MDFSVIATAFVVTIVDGTTVQAFGSHLAVLVCPSLTPAAPTTSPLAWNHIVVVAGLLGVGVGVGVGVGFFLLLVLVLALALVVVLLLLATTTSAAHVRLNSLGLCVCQSEP